MPGMSTSQKFAILDTSRRGISVDCYDTHDQMLKALAWGLRAQPGWDNAKVSRFLCDLADEIEHEEDNAIDVDCDPD